MEKKLLDYCNYPQSKNIKPAKLKTNFHYNFFNLESDFHSESVNSEKMEGGGFVQNTSMILKQHPENVSLLFFNIIYLVLKGTTSERFSS